ncbi:MAG: hypothetical protein LBK08_01540 [Treponema sp.]|nr:hypothetical protein [Treponema sp.]
MQYACDGENRLVKKSGIVYTYGKDGNMLNGEGYTGKTNEGGIIVKP